MIGAFSCPTADSSPFLSKLLGLNKTAWDCNDAKPCGFFEINPDLASDLSVRQQRLCLYTTLSGFLIDEHTNCGNQIHAAKDKEAPTQTVYMRSKRIVATKGRSE